MRTDRALTEGNVDLNGIGSQGIEKHHAAISLLDSQMKEGRDCHS